MKAPLRTRSLFSWRIITLVAIFAGVAALLLMLGLTNVAQDSQNSKPKGAAFTLYEKPGGPRVQESDATREFVVTAIVGSPKSSTHLRGYICRPKGIEENVPLSEVFVLTAGRLDQTKKSLTAQMVNMSTPTPTTTQHQWMWVEILE